MLKVLNYCCYKFEMCNKFEIFLVPLHVLHSRWNSDGQSDRVRKVQQNIPQNRPIQRPINTAPMLRMPIPSQNTIPQAARPTIPTFK